MDSRDYSSQDAEHYLDDHVHDYTLRSSLCSSGIKTLGLLSWGYLFNVACKARRAVGKAEPRKRGGTVARSDAAVNKP